MTEWRLRIRLAPRHDDTLDQAPAPAPAPGVAFVMAIDGPENLARILIIDDADGADLELEV